MPPTQPSVSGPKLLIGYFRSGWGFLIPYLAVYLCYYWFKWPANSFDPRTLGNVGHIPALLHIYWAMHAIHAVLAGLALRSWRSGLVPVQEQGERRNDLPDGMSTGILMPKVLNGKPNDSEHCSTLQAVLPWLLIALVFYIPGAYLEWPADPWEHFRRITEWSAYDAVGIHSAGYKSLYFFAYSFVGWIPASSQLFWLNFYYTGMCMLLAWQYFLFAKTVGLNRSWAFLYVIVNVLTFGNSTFSYFRYYGLASTVFAQIGALAFSRIWLQLAQRRCFLLFSPSQHSQSETPSLTKPAVQRLPSAIFYCLLISVFLLALITASHIQGLGIAGLNIACVAVWRLLKWKRSTLPWLATMAAVLSIAAILWLPRNPLIDSSYRPAGWLNAWYGFNFFSWSSPAADRGVQILGLIGLANLVAGVILSWKNHVAGWLTVGPVIALSLPFVTIPYANLLADREYIFVYERLFFAIPPGMALVVAMRDLWSVYGRFARVVVRREAMHVTLVFSVLALVSIPSSHPSFNRTWHSLSYLPADLTLKNHWESIDAYVHSAIYRDNPHIIVPSSSGYLITIQDPTRQPLLHYRHYANSGNFSAIYDITCMNKVLSNRHYAQRGVASMLLFEPTSFYSRSFAAICSGHWLQQEASLSTAGVEELRSLSSSRNWNSELSPLESKSYPLGIPREKLP